MKLNFRIALTASLMMTQVAFGVCTNWKTTKVGKLDTSLVDEASGLGTSQMEKGKFLWINDSGGKEAIYASDAGGKIVKTTTLKNFPNKDFEAMTVAACLDNKAESCIYVADIGDNMEWRSDYRIGMFKESDFWKNSSMSPVSVIRFQYPRASHNAESMLVTPAGKMIIFSKTESGVSQIFQVEANARVTELGKLNLKELARMEGHASLITDATISPDGKKILILTYSDIIEAKTESVLNGAGRTMTRGTDYNVIKGPALTQQETITYVSNGSFIVSTETENGGIADIISYDCTDKK